MNRGKQEQDEAVLAILESSAVWRALASSLTRLIAAAETSRAVARWRRARDSWHSLGWPARRRAAAVTLIVASATHVALNVAFGTPAGRFWLALSIAPVVVGGLLLLFSQSPDHSETIS